MPTPKKTTPKKPAAKKPAAKKPASTTSAAKQALEKQAKAKQAQARASDSTKLHNYTESLKKNMEKQSKYQVGDLRRDVGYGSPLRNDTDSTSKYFKRMEVHKKKK